MMARALDGIDRIKQVKKIQGLVASGRSSDLPIILEPIVYLAPEMDIGAGKACSKDCLAPSFNCLRTASAFSAAAPSVNRRRY